MKVQAKKTTSGHQEKEAEERDFLRCRVEGVVQRFEEDPTRYQMWNGIAAQLGELTRAEVSILAHGHLDDNRFIRTMELWFGTRWTTNAKMEGADRKRKRSWMTDEDIHRWEAAVRAASAVEEVAQDIAKERNTQTRHAPLSTT
jgi:hypothetical protein